ncbi:MAG: amidohydrolase family protein [Chloroflexi bacterium]|nr:amidohydrolase family protein [Chloroflexota bacterium]
MKLRRFLSGLLLVIGLGLLYLTNVGVLSFDKPYVYKLSGEFPDSNPVVAFANVNVIPMDSERVLEDQTIVVREGVIESIGSSEQVPREALIVDGRGKYLVPGLVDMHVHIQDENEMLLLIANGVTSVRNMWGNTGKMLRFGFPNQLALREQIEQGALFGPTIYTAGPVMEGSPSFHPIAEVSDTPEAARESVAWQEAQGYDFIKVYDHLSPEVYQAIVEAARENDIPVVGHVPFAVGLDGVLESGQQTIEHLTGYIDPDAVRFIIPEDQLDDHAVKTREAHIWNVVTLSEYPKSKETPEGFERLQNQPGMAYVSPFTRMFSPFLYMMAAKTHTYQGADYPERIAELNRRMVAALHEAGAGILLGTDAAQAYHIPGFAVHEELAYLVEAGLSPYEAIEAGTRNAAIAMGKFDEFGTIETGKRADLILLDANPLDDVGNIQKRVGVMLRGRWLTEEQLQSMLDGLVESYQPNLVERLFPLVLIVVAMYIFLRKSR